ncbi:conserved Plasmodium protein, unknown function [Plasmodium knowlesi strain H]|uniref:RAP domain-containing protein n=3 Tax=Plasmodium knowlesi TaxID=5850 RepID=A0A5K1VJC7_PLAKH|nr:conserved Plasmodium protein, unknown function [Plasmodium knowlesi strain H]OTN66213.1 Uncharacterized protein PKNOH_S09518700 [Plasmodium knowlesi]CAA9986355.1 conserved Plasmodium protein, unknown function [Plasmodium knowlesi strain H]SBO25611.1 conserved Plasmodium protein, unknown function [Plasmodium knowlesi strain H]SBO28341.1 conserved Plasmodium protein, unknown function [Plasmodium knowlesi strain H]VVS75829.1 conserved Plasmodium protein, unknown function [Plasmodium knowlesi s|eukprot:XP_002257760.1 hypothetical protein, conserved in Plasmodium species [Plasmodium knowlesi strain H]
MKRASPVSNILKRGTNAIIPLTRRRGRRGTEGRYFFSTKRVSYPTGEEANAPKIVTCDHPPYNTRCRDTLSTHFDSTKRNKKWDATKSKVTDLKKSKIINLINGVKHVEETKNTPVVDLLVDIILQVRYDEGSIIRMKEKHTIGFIWAMAKIVNLVEMKKLMTEQVVLNWKALFIYFAHMYVRRAMHLGGAKGNDVDVRQYVSSVLSFRMGKDDFTKLSTKAFCNASEFANCLFEWEKKRHRVGHPPMWENHPVGTPPRVMKETTSPNDLFRIFSSSCIREMVISVQRYILQRIERHPLDTKTILNFLEMASRNWEGEFKEAIIELLLKKLEAPPNQIHNFSIFKLCRFLNLTVNYNLQRGTMEEAHLPVIIDLLLRGQVYLPHGDCYRFDFSPQGGGSHEGFAHEDDSYQGCSLQRKGNLLDAKTLSNKESASRCSTWLVDANERDLSSLVRDFSRLEVRNNQLYKLLVDCFLLKLDCWPVGGLVYQFGPDKYTDRKGDLVSAHCGSKWERDRHSRESAKSELKLKEVSISSNIGENPSEDSPRSYTTKAEKQNRGIQNTTRNMNLATNEEMRNWVDILVGLANANYHYDPFVQCFIQRMVIKGGNIFFKVNNIPNVVLSLRSLLTLGYDQMDTLSHFFDFLSLNFSHVEMKQLIMIFYATYCYIVQRYNRVGLKYVGTGNMLFCATGGGIGGKVGTEIGTKIDIEMGAPVGVATGAGGDSGGPHFCGWENPPIDDPSLHTAHRLTRIDACAPSPHEQLEKDKAHLFQHLHKLEEAIFHRRNEIDSMQGLVNFFFALSSTINTLSIELYDFFYQSFWRILKEEMGADGKATKGRNIEDTIKPQTVVQICLLHYKNNVVHKTLLSYLLSILETLPKVDIHCLYPITFVCCHLNVINMTFLNFALRVLLGEMAKGAPQQKSANGANSVYQVNSDNVADGSRHIGNDHYAHLGEGSNRPSAYRIAPPTEKHTEEMHHLYSNNEHDTVNKVAKCAWSLLLSNAFLESSIITFAKMCILLRRTFSTKLDWREEDYNMLNQMLICLNMYYKKNRRFFHLKKRHLPIPPSFNIPYYVVKETVRRSKMCSQQKVHMSSFQYKLCEYLKKKKIMYKSEYSLKRGFVVDFVLLKKGVPHLVLEVDGIYHYNMSTDERNYEIEHNGMRLSHNGRTEFRNNVLRILYDLEFVCVPWFFFLQPRSFQRLEGLLSGKPSDFAPCYDGSNGAC